MFRCAFVCRVWLCVAERKLIYSSLLASGNKARDGLRALRMQTATSCQCAGRATQPTDQCLRNERSFIAVRVICEFRELFRFVVCFSLFVLAELIPSVRRFGRCFARKLPAKQTSRAQFTCCALRHLSEAALKLSPFAMSLRESLLQLDFRCLPTARRSKKQQATSE